MIFTSVFFLPQACLRVFRISYYWAAKSSNHSKPICGYYQRVPWASAKPLKLHSTMDYWALTSTSKSVFSNPPPLYPIKIDWVRNVFWINWLFGVEEPAPTKLLFRLKDWLESAFLTRQLKRRRVLEMRFFVCPYCPYQGSTEGEHPVFASWTPAEPKLNPKIKILTKILTLGNADILGSQKKISTQKWNLQVS